MDELKVGNSPPTPNSAPKKVASASATAMEPAVSKQQAVKVSKNVELEQLKLQQAQQEASANRVAQHKLSTEDSKSEVKEAVKRLNDYVQSVQRDLHFNFDEDANMPVIEVIDQSTQKVIRKIPDEVVIRLARNLNQDEPVTLLNVKV